MCATDLMVEDALGPQTNNNTVTLPADAILAFERHNEIRAKYNLPLVTLENYVLTALKEYEGRINPDEIIPPPRGNDELPSSVAARHLVNPELGDEWGAFGRYGKIVVVKIISIDEFIVWVSDHSRIEKGFYRINRRILSLWVYTDPANAETLCDFRPHLWMAGCTQNDPESETYKGILAALHEDYNHAINLL